METLGDRLRRARKAMGLKQHDVARALGLTASAINQWENSGTKPTLERVIKVAEVLRTSPEWLLDGGDKGPMNDDETRLLAAFRRKTPRERAAVLEVVAPLKDYRATDDADEPEPAHTEAVSPEPAQPMTARRAGRSSNKPARKK